MNNPAPNDPIPADTIQRFSSRRQRLDRSFLTNRLDHAQSYDRIAGYFSSSLLEVAGEQLESLAGLIRMVCNSDLDPRDVQTARAAKLALWQSWAGSQPEALLQGEQVVKSCRDLFDIRLSVMYVAMYRVRRFVLGLTQELVRHQRNQVFGKNLVSGYCVSLLDELQSRWLERKPCR
jgi:hypothetical protein